MRWTYFRIEFVDHLDCVSDIAGMNGVLDVDANLNELVILGFMSNVGFFREAPCCGGKALADKIVHDYGVDVPAKQCKG